jgi:predicted nucleotidyltransferase
MQDRDRRILSVFAERVRAVFPAARIWAFGSRTHGEFSEDSDLDVCLVLDHLDASTRRRISDIAWEIGFEQDVLISTVVFEARQFEQGACSVSPLVKSIRTEGIAA